MSKSSILDYKGNFGPQSTWCCGSVSCNGAFSCSSMSYFDSNQTNCLGSYSCSNVTIQHNQNDEMELVCWGSNACSHTNILSSTPGSVACDGHQSCAFAHIQGMQVIYGNAPYALYRAFIDPSDNLNTVNISLAGHLAGYGATLHCKKGMICNIECLAHDACHMMYINCTGNCNIIRPYNDILAPITNTSQLQIGVVDTDAIKNEKLCNAEPSTQNLDVGAELQSSDVIVITSDNDRRICSRAALAAAGIGKVEYISQTNQYVVCSGGQACAGTNWYLNGALMICEAANSCLDAQVNDARAIKCMGSRSCLRATLSRPHFILCAAKKACRWSTMTSGGSDLSVYFSGFESGKNAILNCNGGDTCNIYCQGFDSCVDVQLRCAGECNVDCDKSSKCPIGWTYNPTQSPTFGTIGPTVVPTTSPSTDPTISPSSRPTFRPSVIRSTDSAETTVSLSTLTIIDGVGSINNGNSSNSSDLGLSAMMIGVIVFFAVVGIVALSFAMVSVSRRILTDLCKKTTVPSIANHLSDHSDGANEGKRKLRYNEQNDQIEGPQPGCCNEDEPSEGITQRSGESELSDSEDEEVDIEELFQEHSISDHTSGQTATGFTTMAN